MSDYISREAALEYATRNYYPSIDHYCRAEKVATRKDLESIPAADVRPVVLCRDCVHFTSYSVINEDGTGTCGLCGKRPIGFIVDEYDFCSSGVRRKGGADNGN